MERTIPIFSRDWWLDAVCGDNNWDVVLVQWDNTIIASLPYFRTRKFIFDVITIPMHTQTMGAWIRYPENQKYTNKLSFEKDVLAELIQKLPRVHRFNQKFHYSFTNWLPFYWKGFKQTTRYTYVIEDLGDLDRIFSNFRENIKTDIRKAQKTLTVNSSEDIEKFYNINKLTFGRQKLNIPYSFKFLAGIDNACSKRNCRKIFFAQDKQERVHAAVYIVWDECSAYYLMGGIDPDFKGSGATSLLIWEAIKFSSQVTKKFDFEGSIKESLERFFRAFGAVQKPYFHITKTSSKLLKTAELMREFIR